MDLGSLRTVREKPGPIGIMIWTLDADFFFRLSEARSDVVELHRPQNSVKVLQHQLLRGMMR